MIYRKNPHNYFGLKNLEVFDCFPLNLKSEFVLVDKIINSHFKIVMF